MKNDKGFYDFQQPMSKSQPGKPGGHSANEHGDAHEFNIKGKVTNQGSDYSNPGDPSSGLHGNFSEKDASIAYLKDRCIKGQEINHFSGGQRHSRLHTYNGGSTAYNGNPIGQVYEPATSNKVANAQPVVNPKVVKKE